METKKIMVTVDVEIIVEVPVDVSREDAEKLALFNIEPIIPSIDTKLNDKLIDIEIHDSTTLIVEEYRD